MNHKCLYLFLGLTVLGCQLTSHLSWAENDDDYDDYSESTELDTPEENDVVSLNDGDIRGILEKSSNGQYFYSFLGIPYAKPPIGNLRFKNPEMLEEPWEGVRDGSVAPQPCAQIDINGLIMNPKAPYKGQEDCLYLNIYTPEPNFQYAELPVLVYIHGGQFVSGAASDYEPYDLLNAPLVLVVIQYRLGVLGFMSTEDTVMPGNLGLKDQTMALRWIHKNIEYFGGSPTKITVFGSGAGAASVHYQTFTAHTIGLFKRAILQSGTALCPWAKGGVHKEAAHHIAKHFKCMSEEEEEGKEEENINENEDKGQEKEQNSNDDKTEETEKNEKEKDRSDTDELEKKAAGDENYNANDDDSNDTTETDDETHSPEIEKTEDEIKHEKLLTCLQNVDVQKLVTSAELFYMWSYLPVIFGPRMDKWYFPDTPEFLLKMARHKRVHLIIGINKEDGATLTNSLFISEGRRMALKHHFPLVGPISLEFSDDDIAPLNMSIKAYDIYAGGLSVDAPDAYNLTKLYTDRHYGVCSDVAAEMHATNNERYKRDVYFYQLEHRGQRSTGDQYGLNFGQEWVNHGDELFYLFPFNKTETHIRDEDDQKMTDLMTKMWYFFAETGNPTPNGTFEFTWEPFTKGNRHHLRLTPEPTMEQDTREEAREFWSTLPTVQNMLLNKEYFMKILNQTQSSEDGLDNPKTDEGQNESDNKDSIISNQETQKNENKENKDEL